MSQQQQQPVLTATRTRTYEQKSDMTLWITLSVGFAVVGALGAAHFASRDKKPAAPKPAATVQAKSNGAESVYRCADGRVSFTPCS